MRSSASESSVPDVSVDSAIDPPNADGTIGLRLAEFLLLGFLRIVALVTCLPFMLPTGVCVCGALGVAHAEQPDDTDAPTGGETPPADSDQHAPGCPKVRNLDRPAPPVAPDPSVTVTFNLLPASAYAVLPNGADIRTATDSPHIPLGPPLFVSHCALLF